MRLRSRRQTQGFLRNPSVTRADFRLRPPASDGRAGSRFDPGAFADQGAVRGAQGFGHRRFFPLQAELVQQTARGASGRGRGGAEPRAAGDLLPLAVLLVLVG